MMSDVILVYLLFYGMLIIFSLMFGNVIYSKRMNKISKVLGVIGILGLTLTMTSSLYVLTKEVEREKEVFISEDYEIVVEDSTTYAITDEGRKVMLDDGCRIENGTPITYTSYNEITSKWFGLAKVSDDVKYRVYEE